MRYVEWGLRFEYGFSKEWFLERALGRFEETVFMGIYYRGYSGDDSKYVC